MKRMRRIIFNAATVLSLLLCVLTVVIWMRSYRHGWGACYASQGRHKYALDIAYGQIVASDTDLTATVERRPAAFSAGWYKLDGDEFDEAMWRMVTFPDDEQRFSGWGFAADSGRRVYCFASSVDAFATGGSVPLRVLALPLWFVAVLLAITPLVKLRSLMQLFRRKRNGLCLVCGYDLRATTWRCPECGTVPTGAKT